MTLDGDYPNLQVIMSRLLKYLKENFVEMVKHSASCSLIQQILDLAKGFWHYRRMMSAPPDGQRLDKTDLPLYCQLLWKLFQNHGMDKASIELYIYNYFDRLPVTFQEAFTVNTMLSGWRR